MPYRSEAQRRWAHTKAGMKALGGPEKVEEWDKESKGMKLPERARRGKSMKEALEEAKRRRGQGGKEG